MFREDKKSCAKCKSGSGIVAGFCTTCSSFTDLNSEFCKVVHLRYQDHIIVLDRMLLQKYFRQQFEIRKKITYEYIDDGLVKFEIVFKGTVNLTDYDNLKTLDLDYIRNLDGVLGIQVFKTSIYIHYDIYHFILPTDIGKSVHAIKKFSL